MLRYVTEVASQIKIKTNRERSTAYFMNKLKTVALVSVCLFCAVLIIGTLTPSFVHVNAAVYNQDVFTDIEPASVNGDMDNTKEAEDKVEFVTETRTEDIPYGTTEVGVDTIPRGTRAVASEGICGKVSRTYLVKYVNGERAEEAVYTEFPISSPVNEVVNVGIGGTVTAKDGTTYTYNYRKQMEATAYTYLPPYTTMTTATGETLRKGIVAVDPKVIPLHTKMFITSDSWEYGHGVAEDTGGKIKGNIVDLAYMSYDECIRFGRRQMQVYILD